MNGIARWVRQNLTTTTIGLLSALAVALQRLPDLRDGQTPHLIDHWL